ncbi:MAG: glycosyltransferase family 9 protein [Calditrichia bacterium]
MPVDPKNIRKILVIQLRAIGDILLTTPVLPLLRERFRQAEIHFLTSSGVDSLLTGIPEVNKVITYPYGPGDLLGVIRFIPSIRKEKYDIVIDYQGTPGTAQLTALSGAKYRLGWKMKHRQWAYNLHSASNTRQEYVPLQKCGMLEKIGVDSVNQEMKISIPPESQAQVEKYFQEIGVEPGQFLVNMTPRGKRPARQWHPEKIVRLADLLVEKYHARVFFNWAPGEKEFAQETAGLSAHKIEVLPGWSLAVFAAFLSRADLHFSYDNGPKHLAMAAGTSSLSLFATDPPALWNPLHDPDHPFILSDVPCRFCGLRNCSLMICMKQIEPEDVLREIEQIPAVRKKLGL